MGSFSVLLLRIVKVAVSEEILKRGVEILATGRRSSFSSRGESGIFRLTRAINRK